MLPPDGSALPAAVLEVAVIELSEVQDELLCVLSGQSGHGDDPLADEAPQSRQLLSGPR